MSSQVTSYKHWILALGMTVSILTVVVPEAYPFGEPPQPDEQVTGFPLPSIITGYCGTEDLATAAQECNLAVDTTAVVAVSGSCQKKSFSIGPTIVNLGKPFAQWSAADLENQRFVGGAAALPQCFGAGAEGDLLVTDVKNFNNFNGVFGANITVNRVVKKK